ncbi:1294_t:CDS:1, partial [Funneliformis caledonium]
MGNSRLVSDIGNLVFDNPRDRSLKLEYVRSTPLPSYRSLARPPPTVDTNNKVIASWNPLINAPSFGKIYDATSDPTLLHCVHHTVATTNDHCYVLTKCSGCNLFNTPPTRRGCIFSIPRDRAFYVPVYRKTRNTHANQLEHTLMEITRIAFEAFYGPAAVPVAPISPNIINSIFGDSPYLSQLLDLQTAL